MAADDGPRLQLLAVGPQDVFIRGGDFSHFTTTFKRHTRFSMEPIERTAMAPCVPGQVCRFDVPISADLLAGIHAHVTLPAIPGAHPLDAWVADIGHVLLRRAKVVLNDLVLVDHERLWFDIHKKLMVPAGTRRAALDRLIGHDPLPLTATHTLAIPLPSMPFSTDNGFPLVVLPGNPGNAITLELELEAMEACIRLSDSARGPDAVFESALLVAPAIVVVRMAAPIDEPRDVALFRGDTELATETLEPNETVLTLSMPEPMGAAGSAGWTVRCEGVVRYVVTLGTPQLPAELDVRAIYDMVFLDTEERHVFIRSHHVWMYETVMDQEGKTYRENVSQEGTIDRMDLTTIKVDLAELNYPVRALAWVLYDDDFASSYFTYRAADVDTCRFFLSNREIVPASRASYFTDMTRYMAGTGISTSSTPHDGIHFMSFALRPGLPAPSGAVGFDAARQPFLEVSLKTPLPVQGIVKVFAMVRRFLTIVKGQARFVTM